MAGESLNLIPNFNLPKDGDEYLLSVDKGILKSGNLNIEFDIKDIEIHIGDNIAVNFDMDLDSFNQFEEKILDGKPFSKFRRFSIECTYGNYNVSVLNFIDAQDSIGPQSCGLNGVATCVNLISNYWNTFNANENVEVWDILESDRICQPGFKKFEINQSLSIYLKSKVPENFTIPAQLQDEVSEEHLENESFRQLLNQNSFLYYKTTYENRFPYVVNNIQNLLFFYMSKIQPIRMKVIKGIGNEKLAIIINKNNSLAAGNVSIFSNCEDNFLKFINNSYDYYCSEISSGDFNVDLLIHYYARIKNETNDMVRMVLGSEFIEVLKNIKSRPEKDEQNELYARVNGKLDYLNISPTKLLKILQPDIYDIFLDIKKKCNRKQEFNSQRVHTLWLKINKTYVVSVLVFYRNRIVHTGKYGMENQEIDLFVEFWKEHITNGLTNFPENILDFAIDNIKEEFYDNQLFDVKNQSLFVEYFIEIVLLRLLHVDCTLKREYKLFNGNIDENSNFNSKDLVNNFLK
jgi:hypothetical protein